MPSSKDNAELAAYEIEKAEDAGITQRDLVAYALIRIAQELGAIATHIKYLGNGDAATTMGAIEAYGLHIGEKMDSLSDAIRSLRDD